MIIIMLFMMIMMMMTMVMAITRMMMRRRRVKKTLTIMVKTRALLRPATVGFGFLGCSRMLEDW